MTDKYLRSLVVEELEFEPSIDAEHIGVAVENGVVTLSGHVGSYAEKVAAEQAVKRVKGVSAIAQEIEVRYPNDKKTADDEIAKRAVQIISWHAQVPESVKVKVEKGWVTLTGKVDWQYQRQAAESAVRKLTGVVGVSNLIDLADAAKAIDVKQKIEQALKRNAELDVNAIRVSVAGGKVSLEGKVHTWYERNLAERAAWSAAGVKSVDDKISIAV
ncbi:BON domain-containing protein [Hansschlegelia zhihuaiae]|uniref:BON domain-containing protein n=1 Tax=Hansschlegelia zhihuaiae TaxID=405005 RepID=A0A4Q0M9R7_9HYPH|nr:BON domain-containing protein [Hansschlegelia zhihuaiae]RXF69894.1 BON domain-containing protein [Hansschlegelia zhihuaiae]